MQVTVECSAKGEITLSFSSLSTMESYHLGCLVGVLSTRKVPLKVQSPMPGGINLQFQSEDFEPGLVAEPMLPFAKGAAH